MIPNKIVVRYQNGIIMKGYSNNFLPNKDSFHLVPYDGAADAKPVEIYIRELKAVFFVKDFEGNPQYQEKKNFDGTGALPGRKIQVTFKDGEILVGTTQGYQPGRQGFFVYPADTQSNNIRCYVVSAATQEVSLV